MSEEIMDTLEGLKQDVLWVSLIWRRFNQLYAHSDARSKILSNAAGGFFGMLQRMIVDASIITLSRLTDPPANRYQENLTLQRLLYMVKEDDSKELDEKVSRLFEELENLMEPLRLHRSKRIAHRDFGVALQDYKLPPAIKGDIDRAVELVCQIMNAVEEHYFERATLYEAMGIPGDIDSLLHFLEEGMKNQYF